MGSKKVNKFSVGEKVIVGSHEGEIIDDGEGVSYLVWLYDLHGSESVDYYSESQIRTLENASDLLKALV